LTLYKNISFQILLISPGYANEAEALEETCDDLKTKGEQN